MTNEAKWLPQASWPPRRIWLATCDHSVVGIWATKRAALAGTRMGRLNSMREVAYFIAGPYLLRGGR